ncbi:MAG: acyltransferase [Gemmatimonadota bacterium]
MRDTLDRFWKAFEPGHGDVKTLQAMEGLRAIAVFLVFLVHYAALFEVWLPSGSVSAFVSRHMASIGNAGVDLFFVISGFLIYRMLVRRPRPLPTYLGRRIQRIYPTFLAVLALYVVVSWVLPSVSKLPSDPGAQVVYLIQNLFLLPGIFDIEPIITVAWSLSYEFCFYLAVPLVVWVFQLRRWAPATRLVVISVLCVLVFLGMRTVRGAPYQMLMFGSGMLLSDALLARGNRHWPALGIPALLLSFVGMILILELQMSSRWRLWLLFILYFFVVMESIRGLGPFARFCSLTPLRRFGNMSYSYFLLHGFAVRMAMEVIARVWPASWSNAAGFWLLLMPVFLFSIIPCAALFLWVERPLSLERR